jgi:hypothetical protein
MRDPNAHLSDRDLIMAADGELPERRKDQARAHLDACWSCRARMSTLESTIGEFVRARDRELSHPAPSVAGPRALFRARLAETAALTPSSRFWRLAPAAAFFSVAAAILIVFEAAVSAEGPKPKPRLTPGETRPITLDQVCRSPKAEVISTDIPLETRRQVFASYGIHPTQVDEFEVDYLITPDLGGASSIRNLWPQPYSARWNARVKDELEQRLHDLVCQGKLDLSTAQRDLATDWIGAYKKYFGVSAPQSAGVRN